MVNPNDIPTGTDRESIRKREAVISDFYRKWYESHPSKKVRNIDLKDDINVRYISVTETVRHAAISYLSTLAVLQLDLVLKTARRVGKPKPVKPNDKPVRVCKNSDHGMCARRNREGEADRGNKEKRRENPILYYSNQDIKKTWRGY